MPRRDRSLFSDEGDFSTHPLLKELIRVVEALARGWSVETPFRVIMQSIGEILMLLRNLLAEGIPSHELTINTQVNEGVEATETGIKKRFRLLSVWSPSPTGKWLQETIKEPDPLFDLRDSKMNVTSRKTTVANPSVGLDPRLEEWLDNIITTSFALADNPSADPNFMMGEHGTHKEQKKLNHQQFGYYRRKRAFRKMINKEHK